MSKAERPDAVVTFGNPPIIGIAAALVARRSRARFVYVLYDIHPDILQSVRVPDAAQAGAVGVRSRAPLGPEAGRRHRGPGTRDETHSRGEVRESTQTASASFPLWARPELGAGPGGADVRRELNVDDDALLVSYAGNMGVMHPLDGVLDAAKRCRGLPVHFLLVGDGARRAGLAARVRDEGIAQVSLLPFQSEARFAEIMAATDLSIVVLKPGLEGLAVPSKAYTAMGAGKPIVAIMRPEADVAKLAVEHDCGWNVESADDLADLLRGLLDARDELARRGANGRSAYEQHYTRARAVEEYLDVLV